MTLRNGGVLAAAADEAAPPPVEAREDRRRQILWSGVLQTAQGPCQCLVLDISRGGARVSVPAAVAVGQAVTLVVTGLGLFRGSVVWSEPGGIGIRFAPESAPGRA